MYFIKIIAQVKEWFNDKQKEKQKRKGEIKMKIIVKNKMEVIEELKRVEQMIKDAQMALWKLPPSIEVEVLEDNDVTFDSQDIQ